MTQMENLTEYVQAMKTVKRFKNLFLVLILLSILFQLNSFILLEFTTVLDKPEPTTFEEATASLEEENLPPTPEKPQPLTPREAYLKTMDWGLPITKFVAMACTTLLVFTLMLAGGLSLLAHGKGTTELVGSMFWAVILLGMVIPWQQVYNSSVACGALFNTMELTLSRDAYHLLAQPSLQDKIFFYGRFLVYPAAAFLVWWIVVVKFAHGYRKLTMVEPKTTSVGM
ncbi:MAG: hypothetical protein JXA11_00155 [Phycisphaerae bacterium]|nr:hypothetical protein [Phycisphaerae bacterium]